MGIKVNTIFRWDDAGISDEGCEQGQCVGIVLEVAETPIKGANRAYTEAPILKVRFWDKCIKHNQIDPDGDGPYPVDHIWQIGQL